jgi:uncharacterized protein HemX
MAKSNKGSAESDTAPPTADDAVAAPRAPSRWPGVLAVLALLVSLAAAGAAGFSAWQFAQVSYVPRALDSSASDLAGLTEQLNRLNQVQAEQQSVLRDFEVSIDAAVTQLKDVPLRLEQVETLVKSVPGINADRRSEWLTAEALYYLKLANAQASLTGNAAVAASALQLADEKLRESGDPRLTAVRAQLSDEITALRAVPSVDRAGISFRLQSLITQVPEWSLRTEAPTSFRPEVELPQGDLGPWERFTETLKAVFASVISVKKVEGEPVALQLSVAERSLVLENIKSELQIARLAFLGNDEALFKQSLKHCIEQINRYFNVESEGVAAALETLNELSATGFVVDIPDISTSLAMFLAIGESQ